MNNYNPRSKFGGKGGFDNKRGGERSGGRGFDRPMQLHKAVCADCGKTCEVPFKPNGMKPVYCKDCFAKNGGQVTTNHFSSKAPRQNSEQSSQNSYTQNTFAPKPQNDKKFDDQVRLLETMNVKFDKLITLTENLISKFEKPTSHTSAPVEVEKTEKKVSKKVVAKKK